MAVKPVAIATQVEGSGLGPHPRYFDDLHFAIPELVVAH